MSIDSKREREKEYHVLMEMETIHHYGLQLT